MRSEHYDGDKKIAREREKMMQTKEKEREGKVVNDTLANQRLLKRREEEEEEEDEAKRDASKKLTSKTDHEKREKRVCH